MHSGLMRARNGNGSSSRVGRGSCEHGSGQGIGTGSSGGSSCGNSQGFVVATAGFKHSPVVVVVAAGRCAGGRVGMLSRLGPAAVTAAEAGPAELATEIIALILSFAVRVPVPSEIQFLERTVNSRGEASLEDSDGDFAELLD